MSSPTNSRAVPVRLIIMILIAVAIICAAIGVYGLITRNDDPQAALNAQESIVKETATKAASAGAPICLVSVNRSNVADANEALIKAGSTPTGDPQNWPARPAPPDETTVFYDEGAQDQAKKVSEALPGSTTAAKPEGLAVCADAIAVAVVTK